MPEAVTLKGQGPDFGHVENQGAAIMNCYCDTRQARKRLQIGTVINPIWQWEFGATHLRAEIRGGKEMRRAARSVLA